MSKLKLSVIKEELMEMHRNDDPDFKAGREALAKARFYNTQKTMFNFTDEQIKENLDVALGYRKGNLKFVGEWFVANEINNTPEKDLRAWHKEWSSN